MRKVLDGFRLKANRGFQITGSPHDVAEELARIVGGSDVDGIMLEPTFGGPGFVEDFVGLVLPLLRERGMLRDVAQGATLRERLSGRPGGRLPTAHRGARFRPRPTPPGMPS